MCGIVAEFHPGGHVQRSTLDAGLSAIRHRGPDGSGIWLRTGIGLGHVRLAILDLAGSPQPIASEDGKVVVAVNGEFYDHERQRAELERRGHRFRTGGDSEIAAHLYEDHGLAFLDHLRGEFALVLWDDRQRILVAARDRFGVKPLCWHRDGRRLLVASEAKALFAMGVAPMWDEKAFFQVACMQYLPPRSTLFKGVHQLPPGKRLVADDREITIQPYWDMQYPREEDKPHCDPVEAPGRLRGALDEAVGLRLRADVPVACHLSGGLDSSAVAALARRRLGCPVTCFTVGFDRPGYDESEQARATAEALGADWRAVRLGQRELADALPDAVYFSEGLAINAHLPAKFLLAKAMRAAGFPVVLSGEGADELLGGYAHFRNDLWQADPNRRERLAAANPMVAGMHLPEGDTLPLDHVRACLGYLPTFLQAKASLGRRMHTLLREEYRRRFAGRDAFRDFLASFGLERLSGRHVVDQSSYLWSKSALANYILRTLGDGTEMAHAVEGRLPFLDHHFFDLVSRLPTGLKIRGDTEKWVLREAMRELLPESVLRRSKQPFTAPPFSLTKCELFADTLRSRAVGAAPFFDPGAVRAILDQLPHLPERERLAWDPVLMLVLTACLAQVRFRL
jgi:asparagine synthase (glutamine-hydrolysing)